MKVLLSWLRDFAPIEGDPVALGEQMSDLGMAVEQLDVLGEGLDGIVVAEVLTTRPHPNADQNHPLNAQQRVRGRFCRPPNPSAATEQASRTFPQCLRRASEAFRQIHERLCWAPVPARADALYVVILAQPDRRPARNASPGVGPSRESFPLRFCSPLRGIKAFPECLPRGSDPQTRYFRTGCVPPMGSCVGEDRGRAGQ